MTSVLDQKFVTQVPARGTRLARRDEGAHGACVTEEQRSQAGCPARDLGDELLIPDTSTRRFVCAVAVVCLCVAQVAAQQPVPNVNDGQALTRECGEALNQADNGPITNPDELERGSDMGQCLGLVTGVWHTHMMMVDDFGAERHSVLPGR